MNSTLSIHLPKRRRDHDGSDYSIIRWRRSYMHWYSNPHIRREGAESRSPTPFQSGVGHTTIKQQASIEANLGHGRQGLRLCPSSCERVLGRGHRPRSKFPSLVGFCEIRNFDRSLYTKLTTRASERSRTGITTTWLRASWPGNLGCSSATRCAQCLS